MYMKYTVWIKKFILCLFFFILFVILNKQVYRNDFFLSQSNIQSQIPKILIQTWKTKTIPEKYKEDVASVKKYNKEYTFLFFDDLDIITFIQTNFPVYYSTYVKLPILIQKIDFFRYLAVYHYGGFYFDLDMKALYPLDELLTYECVFPIDQKITPNKCKRERFHPYCERNIDFLIGQYAFGAIPHHPFIKLLIDTIHTNIDSYIEKYAMQKDEIQYVYSSTGPDFVTNVYIDTPNKESIHILESKNAQYFGKYAKHNYYGTWK